MLLTQGTTQPSSAQLTPIKTACQQWLGSDPGLGGQPQWCTDMTNWMSRYMSHNSTGPQMMWGDANHLLGTCEDWMSADPPPGTITTPETWCSAMVTWMASHRIGVEIEVGP